MGENGNLINGVNKNPSKVNVKEFEDYNNKLSLDIQEYATDNTNVYDNSIIEKEHPCITKLRKMLDIPFMCLDESIKYSTVQTEAAYRGYIGT